jgi:hypothetical protein
MARRTDAQMGRPWMVSKMSISVLESSACGA